MRRWFVVGIKLSLKGKWRNYVCLREKHSRGLQDKERDSSCVICQKIIELSWTLSKLKTLSTKTKLMKLNSFLIYFLLNFCDALLTSSEHNIWKYVLLKSISNTLFYVFMLLFIIDCHTDSVRLSHPLYCLWRCLVQSLKLLFFFSFARFIKEIPRESSMKCSAAYKKIIRTTVTVYSGFD